MDKEINIINDILSHSKTGLTIYDISKIFNNTYKIKISPTIVKNYLWSYFRNIINYDNSKYTYTLKNDKFLHEDIDVISISNTTRPLQVSILGSRIKVEFNKKIPIEIYIKAISILNFKVSSSKKNIDLFDLPPL
ncbi:hypothetical protein BH10BAC5_BH10BAC5_25400 [soil metagenome]